MHSPTHTHFVIVFNKLVVTALKYTPIVLEHHVPFKTLSNGKLLVHPSAIFLHLPGSDNDALHSKAPTQTPKLKALQKLILSYFQSVIRLISQLSDPDMQHLAVKESARVIPYIVTSRKTVRAYLKVNNPCLIQVRSILY